jgi:hypothetical protein
VAIFFRDLVKETERNRKQKETGKETGQASL